MRPVLLLLPPLGLLAGCAAAPPLPPASPTAASAEVRAWFPPHGLADAIEIDTVYRLPLAAAVLVAPDGGETPANYVNAVAEPSNIGGQWAASHTWQNAVTGSNSFAAVNETAQTGPALRAETALLAVASTADLPLPDAVAYRRDWQHYRIRLTFGTVPAEHQTEEIAAPAPPPAPPPPAPARQ